MLTLVNAGMVVGTRGAPPGARGLGPTPLAVPLPRRKVSKDTAFAVTT